MGRHWTDTFFEGAWNDIIGNVYTAEETRAEALFIRRALRLRKGSRVLDVPCGDGRISLELARTGCRVVGVDMARQSVARARRRGRSSGLDVEFLVGDMRRLEVEGPFSAAVNWWGSFGYFDEAANLDFLRRLRELLSPGGRVLVDQVNRERVLRNFMRKAWDEYGPVTVHVRNRWDPLSERIEGTWTMVKGESRQRRRSSIRLYTPRQMERLMARAGLTVERVYGGSDGSEHTRGSRRMITVAGRD